MPIKRVFRLSLRPKLRLYFRHKHFSPRPGEVFGYDRNHPFRRWDAIVPMCARFSPCRYLEIGVRDLPVFRRMEAAGALCTGVDPNPSATHPSVRLETSDSFFAHNRERFDVIFIDGDHSHAQSLRDLNHAIACLAPGGVIFLHDANPFVWGMTHKRLSYQVYKTIASAADCDFLDLVVIREDHGVAVVQVKAPGIVPPLEGLTWEQWAERARSGRIRYQPWEQVQSEHPLYQ